MWIMSSNKVYILEGHDRGLYFELKYGRTYTIMRSPEKAVYISDSYAEDLDKDDKVTESMQLMNIRWAIYVSMCCCLGTGGAIYADSIDRF